MQYIVLEIDRLPDHFALKRTLFIAEYIYI